MMEHYEQRGTPLHRHPSTETLTATTGKIKRQIFAPQNAESRFSAAFANNVTL
jgi:hypothetical protein